MTFKALILIVLVAGVPIAVGCNTCDPGEEPALKDADAYAARAYDWLCRDRHDRALRDYDRAIELEPGRAAFWNSRGFTWHMKGIGDPDRLECEDRALADYAEAIRLDPNNASAINNRAWLRATTKVEQCRDGKSALAEATRACELTGWKNAGYLDTLSVAYAEIGDFQQAVGWQRRALEDAAYAREEGDNARAKLALYAKQRPFRE